MTTDLFQHDEYSGTWRVPAQRHSPTSRAAAVAMQDKTPSLREKVLDFYRSHPQGATDEHCYRCMVTKSDISDFTKDSTIRARRIELTRAGYLRDSGRTELTASGESAVVWVVAKEAK